MIKIKNRYCYTVTLILCGTLFLTGLTGCKSREAQFLIEGLQEAKAEVDAESSEEKTSGQKSKKDTDEKKADTEDRQNDGGNSAEFRKKQAESDSSDAGNGTGSDSGKHTSDADIDNGSEAVSDKEMQQAMIYVDVCGAVANPGVFQLAAGSRVFQAIEAAGGYLPEAALTCVNRAGVLTDGQQLYILTQEEMERQGLDPAEMAGASDGQMNGSAGTGQNTGMTAQVQQDNRININTADEAQLTTLTGIGATRAQAIIAYREENGPFAAIEDIMNVQGIKEGTFAKIKDEIVVG
ncbi:helix-hairpin-helix domain-containing protein [Blautia wexlerae]|uniref:ComEA family DNA-binding protein n=1 Tax=Blautia TaxID=572511 RepID=UPI001D08A42D|nr:MULTISPECIES: ComEA family DNA-binding protein [Blautia]MCB6357798.1 helix-hairpin-helix domain-containing protein [Blautia wexlerae]MCB8629609.1 helix-hairpin-helix domain-containing protein [Blautia sp. DFI.6.71]